MAVLGCDSDESDSQRFLLYLSDMGELAEDSTYETWLVSPDDEYLSLGRFNAPNSIVSLSYPVTDELLAATKILVSIELNDVEREEPSDSILLGGYLLEGVAELSANHPDALNTDFIDASGSYLLTTPSTIDDEDFYRGVWWYNPGLEQQHSLFLPELPTGWTYESWVQGIEEPLSMGKFLLPYRVDADGPGATAGPIEEVPQFPGQDYIFPPTDLSGLSVFVTAEPNPDDSEDPFFLRILLDKVIEEIDVNQPAENVISANFPTGRTSLSFKE